MVKIKPLVGGCQIILLLSPTPQIFKKGYLYLNHYAFKNLQND
jgi:hypothetical protein